MVMRVRTEATIPKMIVRRLSDAMSTGSIEPRWLPNFISCKNIIEYRVARDYCDPKYVRPLSISLGNRLI
jgi:hypothetical protein